MRHHQVKPNTTHQITSRCFLELNLLSFSHNTCASTLSTTNPTRLDLERNPNRSGGKKATNCLRWCTANSSPYSSGWSRGKGKVVPVLNQALRHEGVWGSWCIDPRFLIFGTRWRCVVRKMYGKQPHCYLLCVLAKCISLHRSRPIQTTNTVASVRERTIPTERPPLVNEVSANFCGQRSWGFHSL
jgi:hypothetical protein